MVLTSPPMNCGSPAMARKRVSNTALTAIRKIDAADCSESTMLSLKVGHVTPPRSSAMTSALKAPNAAASVAVVNPL